MTTSDDELRRRFADLREALLPQLQGADLTVTRRRGRALRARRVVAVAAMAMLVAVAAGVGTRLPAFPNARRSARRLRVCRPPRRRRPPPSRPAAP